MSTDFIYINSFAQWHHLVKENNFFNCFLKPSCFSTFKPYKKINYTSIIFYFLFISVYVYVDSLYLPTFQYTAINFIQQPVQKSGLLTFATLCYGFDEVRVCSECVQKFMTIIM